MDQIKPRFVMWGTGPASVDTRESWREWLLIPDDGQPAASCEFMASRSTAVAPHQCAPLPLAPGDSVAIPFNPGAIWAAAMDTPLDEAGMAWMGDPVPGLQDRLAAQEREIARLQTLLAAIPDEVGGDWAAQVRQATRAYNGE